MHIPRCLHSSVRGHGRARSLPRPGCGENAVASMRGGWLARSVEICFLRVPPRVEPLGRVVVPGFVLASFLKWWCRQNRCVNLGAERQSVEGCPASWTSLEMASLPHVPRPHQAPVPPWSFRVTNGNFPLPARPAVTPLGPVSGGCGCACEGRPESGHHLRCPVPTSYALRQPSQSPG